MNAPRYQVERTSDTYETRSARDAWMMAYRVARSARRICESRPVSMTRIFDGNIRGDQPITRTINL